MPSKFPRRMESSVFIEHSQENVLPSVNYLQHDRQWSKWPSVTDSSRIFTSSVLFCHQRGEDEGSSGVRTIFWGFLSWWSSSWHISWCTSSLITCFLQLWRVKSVLTSKHNFRFLILIFHFLFFFSVFYTHAIFTDTTWTERCCDWGSSKGKDTVSSSNILVILLVTTACWWVAVVVVEASIALSFHRKITWIPTLKSSHVIGRRRRLSSRVDLNILLFSLLERNNK